MPHRRDISPHAHAPVLAFTAEWLVAMGCSSRCLSRHRHRSSPNASTPGQRRVVSHLGLKLQTVAGRSDFTRRLVSLLRYHGPGRETSVLADRYAGVTLDAQLGQVGLRRVWVPNISGNSNFRTRCSATATSRAAALSSLSWACPHFRQPPVAALWEGFIWLRRFSPGCADQTRGSVALQAGRLPQVTMRCGARGLSTLLQADQTFHQAGIGQ